MNRRKFLKFISSFLATIPFVPFDNLQYGEEISDPPIIIGVDKAKKQSDYSISFLAVTIDGKDRFIPLHDVSFEVTKEYCEKNVMQPRKEDSYIKPMPEGEWIIFE